jgi:hypothetical protein
MISSDHPGKIPAVYIQHLPLLLRFVLQLFQTMLLLSQVSAKILLVTKCFLSLPDTQAGKIQ